MVELFLLKKEEGTFFKKGAREIRIVNGNYILIDEEGKFYGTTSIDEARNFLTNAK